MNRRAFNTLLGSSAFRASLQAAPPGAAKPPALERQFPRSPFDVKSNAQLFVDQLLVRESPGVSFTMHPGEKHPRNPLMVADQPWEGWNVELFGSVLYDNEEKKFKMWYVAHGADLFRYSYPTMYAASSDGLVWEKPLVGTIPAKNGMRHNVVTEAQQANVIKDVADPDPQKRYKMIAWIDAPQPEKGYYTFVSPDGFAWRRYSAGRIAPHHLTTVPASVSDADNITGYYDERRGLYVAFSKIMVKFGNFYRRSHNLIYSRDFVEWSDPLLVLAADERDDAGMLRRIEESRPLLDAPDDPALMRTEFYGLGVYPAESCTLAFLWVFTVNNKATVFPKNQEGPGELQLASSRDLVNWDRPFRTPCIRRGNLQEWDNGFFMTAARALRVGDEIWLYYDGENFTHGAPVVYKPDAKGRGTTAREGVGLAKWKLDRFVSADGPAEGGTLTTVPVVFSGERLEINADTRTRGRIAVELLDAAERPLPGFELSDPFSGDDLRATVTWNGQRDLTKLRGKPVMVRFYLHGAELYSYAFRPAAKT